MGAGTAPILIMNFALHNHCNCCKFKKENDLFAKSAFCDLAGKNINDDELKIILSNPIYSRIRVINLSGNPKITNDSIDFILNDLVLGSLREAPEISGKFGCASSTIIVNAHGTQICNDDGKWEKFEKHIFEFEINYTHPLTGKNTARKTDGVKFVEITW
jgi:hypothetical protein